MLFCDLLYIIFVLYF